MKNYDEINRELPYRETPEYLDGLISRCKEQAMGTASQRRSSAIRPWMYGLAAAIVAAVLTLSITLTVRKSPIEKFLANITDEEAAMIINYNVENISFSTNE